jgi:hypothetical protein
MQRRTLLESYALLVCLLMLIGFLVSLYYLGRNFVAREAPEYTINSWTYYSHQTNERYLKYARLGDSRPKPSDEAAITAERERSWEAEQQLERRNATRNLLLSGIGAAVTSVVFWIHWRVARRSKRDERGTENVESIRPLILASVAVFGLSCSFCSGLVGGLLISTGGGYSSRYEEEFRAMTPILADPAFGEVEIHARSGGGIYLSGVVQTEPNLERLRAQVARALGERRSNEATGDVQVRLAASRAP